MFSAANWKADPARKREQRVKSGVCRINFFRAEMSWLIGLSTPLQERRSDVLQEAEAKQIGAPKRAEEDQK
jgi:hypothetical protein